MKQLLVSVGIVLTAGHFFAQTNQLNLQKYWKLRNDFREKYVKIGPAQGESLPAGALLPNDCVDTYDVPQDGTPFSGTKYGEMRWGDGMIFHGHYLGLLATEYRLLKNNGQDVTGVLNELFYALNAVNRLDLRAEPEQDFFYGLNLEENLNGYFLREDIPEDFAKNNWLQTEMRMGCTNSVFYKNNNIGKLNETNQWGESYSKGNTYQNVPSQDQLTSLFVGFSLIHKLVDTNEFVQPPGSEFGFNIVDETKAIVNRMMTFMESHNWQLIDVHGWPVNNMSGDMMLSAYPLFHAALRITGQGYNSPMYRKIVNFHLKNVIFCITGFGVDNNDPVDREEACDDINVWDVDQWTVYNQLLIGVPASPANNQDYSAYQGWQLQGQQLPMNCSMPVWELSGPNAVLAIINDFNDDGKIQALPFPANQIRWSKDNANHYGFTVFFNLGVASGRWSSSVADTWAQNTGNYELALINSIIRNEAPVQPASFYAGFLNNMEFTGPYNLEGISGNSIATKAAPNGWSTDYRWISDPTNPNAGEPGIYNGMDYMLFHNLYYLNFPNEVPAFKQVDSCFCGTTPTYVSQATNTPEQEAENALLAKLPYVPVCTKNVFEPTFNLVNNNFDVKPFFSNYTSMSIFPTKYQTENATVTATGDVNVKTRFKICSAKTLTIQAGGRMDIEKAAAVVGYNAKIDNSGDVVVKSGTTLTVEALGKLILRSGSKLIIEHDAKVIIEEGAFIEYYGGASIIMHEPTSQLRLGSTIKVMDGGEFTITHTGINAGKLIVTSPSAALLTATPNVGKFKLVGKGIGDPSIILEPNTKLWAMNNFAQSLTIQQCKIEFGAGASLQCDQPFYTASVEFNSTATNGGLTLAEGSLMNSSRFINVPLFAKMNIENKGTLEMYNCYLLADNPALNPSNQALVEVTGRSYKIGSCNLYTTKNYGIYSAITLASTIGGGSIQYYGTLPVSHTLTGIYDNSTVELAVNSVTITKCNTGAKKLAGKLTLRCNTFINNKDVNVFAGASSTLNMRAATLGGYNQLYKTTNNKNIHLGGCYLADIKTGYNYIEYTGVANTTIAGSTNSYCNTCPTLDFSGNQWNPTNKSPINIASVYNANGLVQFAYTTAPTALWQTCPASNVPTPPGDPNGKSLVAADGMPIIYSTIVGDSTRLDEMVYRASEKMSMYNDSTANDLEAVDLLNDVFIANLDKTDSITNYWSWFAVDQMKAALESAFAKDQLTIANNSSSFDPYVAKYTHAMMVMSDSVIDSNNYVKQFIHEINKAHLLRVIGHSDKGLNILTELEACGLDSAEQAHLNYWKQEFEKDLVIEEIGFAAIDSVIVIDTNDYLNPALVVNAYSFGAIIHDLNDIQYPNCSFFDHRDKRTGFGVMQVFPNPATDEVRISWNHPLMEGEGVLQVQQSDGRMVLTKKIDTNESTGITLRVSDWKPGVYQIKYRSPKGVVSTAQLVVQ